MFKFIIRVAGVAVLGLGTLDAGTVLAQDSDSFFVRNSGTVPLSSVRISPDYSTQWSGDQLSDEIPPGGQAEVPVNGNTGDCFFDVQVDDGTGNSREFWGVNLCSDRYLDVRRHDGVGVAPKPAETHAQGAVDAPPLR